MIQDRQAQTDEFYQLLDDLARRESGPRRLGDCRRSDGWPLQGVYFFYEDGEARADGSRRVVRVGTHGLTPTSKTTLWGRLRQHRGQLSGSNLGGGNHRASIFRAHVGTALIRRGNWPEGLLEAWTSHHPRPEWATDEAQVELEVSRHIRAMPFVWLAVPSRPDRSSDRGYIESNAIALLSCVTGGQDRPSAGWLGHHAARTEIQRAGLWNVEHVNDRYDPGFLRTLTDLVAAM